MGKLKEQMDVVIGHSLVDIEARFTKIRSEETNISAWYAKMCLFETKAEMCIINSGTFREDRVVEKGEIKLAHAKRLFPMEEKMVVIEVGGEKIHEALENGVSSYESCDGRFCAVAGVKFKWNRSLPAYERIRKEDIYFVKYDYETGEEREEPLDYGRSYKLCVKSYLAHGKDGYVSLLNPLRCLVDEESALSVFQHYTLTFTQFDLSNSHTTNQVSHHIANKIRFLGSSLH